MTHNFAESTSEFELAIAQFNQGEFYACHDTLEAIWNDALVSDRGFYQGVLQIAVALHHLENRNWNGAKILLGEGVNRLRRFVPEYETIDVARLVEDSHQLLIALQLGDNESEFLDLSIPKITRYVSETAESRP